MQAWCRAQGGCPSRGRVTGRERVRGDSPSGFDAPDRSARAYDRGVIPPDRGPPQARTLAILVCLLFAAIGLGAMGVILLANLPVD